MRILRCNRAYARAAGLGYGQIVGRPYYQVFPRTCEPMTGCAQTVEHDANGDGVEDFTLEDQGRSFRVKCYAIRNPVGAFLHALHVLEDVTEHRRAEQEIRDLLMAALTSLAHAIEAKSPWTRGHSERVTQYTVQIGEALGLPEDELAQLRIAALLHDIGKIGTADGLLDKPDRLTPEEYETIKLHPATGAGMLSPIKQLHPIIPWVRGHHERYDGNGYPDGLAGEAIPLQARILAVADTFDAMTAERPYRATPGRERAIHELRQNAGSQLDPQVVAAFLLVLDEGPDRHFRAA